LAKIGNVAYKWQSFDDSMATWEDRAEILRTFPNFNLEDKVEVNGESIVRNIIEETMIGNDKSMTTKDHVATDPQSVELRRSTRERKANPKYNKG
jgi:hypothetical protein